ncbi:MAG: pentapeptide repeat-containing protein [Candidatus Hydrogenedentes bacterium]|nr:pentapeptide repeat-containing protein [Candidatus Hydrogenedentota bacterium]
MTECTFQNIVMPEDASPSPSDAPIFAESKFQQTKFVSTVFVETDFTNVEFDDCDFGNRLFRRCNFRSAKFRFKENVLARLYFIECDLAYAKFNEAFLDQSKFDGCEFEGTDFNRCRMDRVSFKDAKNLHKIRGSISCLIQSDNSGRPEDVIDFDRYEPPWHVRWFTWEFLRKFGQIPLFGVSYSIITVMILATWGLQRLNEFVSHAQIWVEKTAQVPEEWVKLTGDVLREGLTGLVLGRQSVALFVGAVCLAIASTIYALACDNRIKEYSKDAWTIIHGKSSFHYLPLSWQFWYLRWPCALLYIFGGLLVLAVLAFRIVQVFSYMLQQI